MIATIDRREFSGKSKFQTRSEFVNICMLIIGELLTETLHCLLIIVIYLLSYKIFPSIFCLLEGRNPLMKKIYITQVVHGKINVPGQNASQLLFNCVGIWEWPMVRFAHRWRPVNYSSEKSNLGGLCWGNR